MELLEQAVTSIKSGKDIDTDFSFRKGVDIELQMPAFLPEIYIPDVHTRLLLYKRLSKIQDLSQGDDFQAEMIDRFGPCPEPTKNLLKISQLKIKAKELGITKMEVNAKSGRFEFSPSANIDPIKLIQLIQKQPTLYKLEGPTRFRFNIESTSSDRMAKVGELMDALKLN